MTRRARPGATTAALSSALLALCALLFVGSAPGATAAESCCRITSIDTGAAVVTAHESATGRAFQFAVKDSLLLFTLKVGQPVSANFDSKQVSIGGAVCCTILSASSSALPKTSRPGLSGGPPANAAAGGPGVALPKISILAGPPARTVLRRETHWESRRLTTTIDGKPTDIEVLHLRGVKGIEGAQGLPDTAKQFLLAHARTLRPDEVAHYVVNRKLVEAWAKTHTVPESLKHKGGGGSHSGCHSISVHCADEAVKHAEGEVAKQADALRRQADDEWKHLAREVGRDLKMTEDLALKCFADQTLASGPRRVSVSGLSVSADLPIDLSGKDGRVSGRARIALRRIDLKADVEIAAFVIPCAFVVTAFPAWVRPKSVSINGTLTVGSAVDLELHARGAFHKSIPMPFPAAPVQIVPPIVIMVGEVPVEFDIGLEYEGQVAIDAVGLLDARLRMEDEQAIPLNFTCDGHGCRQNGEPTVVPGSRPSTHELQLSAQGRVTITPSVFPALRLDVNLGALAARVGPEVYVTADFRGAARADCISTRPASATAAAAGLSADVYGGINLRYLVEFLRPELPGADSAVKNATVKGQSQVVRQKLGSFPVGALAAAQPGKPGAASAPCPK
ncbi:MAG: hypothetical protein DME04_15440 [Candidatus Rokuibacteriota bacterium]|nr:MAG: hypothetical protein DME04_15440 [Candidatus Rokubacteria bacterium]